jgi:hypothetical protein
MKNKIILLIVLGLLFCINLNKLITNSKTIINKNDHTTVITQNNENSQNIGILDLPCENIVEPGIYTTSIISFNVEPINSINEVFTATGMIHSKTMLSSEYNNIYTSGLLNKSNNNNNITTKLSILKILQKTFVSVEINNKKWNGVNIYLSQITKKLGRT